MRSVLTRLNELDTVFASNFKNSILIRPIGIWQLLGISGHEYLPARWSCDDPMTATRCSNVSIAMGYPFWQVYDPASANFNAAPLSQKARTSFEEKKEPVLVPMDMERRTQIWCLRGRDYRQ